MEVRNILIKSGLRIALHEESFSKKALVINSKSFPSIQVNDILCLFTESQETGDLKHPSLESQTKDKTRSLYYKVDSLEQIKGNFQLSLLRSISARMGITLSSLVTLEKVTDLESIELHDVEVSFKNHYIGRSDMWRIKESLLGCCIYRQDAVSLGGLRLQIDEVHRNSEGTNTTGYPISSGLITKNTHLTFRSRSAQLKLMVQLSEEMFNYAEDGEKYFEKITGFLRILAQEWQHVQAQHAIKIIFFSRTYFGVVNESGQVDKNTTGVSVTSHLQSPRVEELKNIDFEEAGCKYVSPENFLSVSPSGQLYQDNYKTVVDLIYSQGEWDKALKQVKEELLMYPETMNWGAPHTLTGLIRYPSTASNGNLLEAVNCVVTMFGQHYLDRSMNKTGQNMVILTAGSTLFEVGARLAQATKDSILANGVGCDVISMARPPIHKTPLFYLRQEPGRLPSRTMTNATEDESVECFYVPHWMAAYFFDYQDFHTQVLFLTISRLELSIATYF
jgi:hypothetical protein